MLYWCFDFAPHDIVLSAHDSIIIRSDCFIRDEAFSLLLLITISAEKRMPETFISMINLPAPWLASSLLVAQEVQVPMIKQAQWSIYCDGCLPEQ